MKDLLAPIRERLAKATPGPWKFTGNDTTAIDEVNTVSTDQYYIAIKMGEADGKLIAHAPEDLRRLIEVVELMMQRLEAIDRRAGSASAQSGFTDALEVAEWARDTLAKARKILEGK